VDFSLQVRRSKCEVRSKFDGSGRDYLIRNSEALTIGRDPACGIVVDGEHASRQHCVIARRNDKFVLSDKSTNGTFVTVEGEEELILQRDEITLRKQGWISFGRPRGAGGDVVEFFCD